MDNPENTHPPHGTLAYRLLTGKDDQAFCARVSEALKDGWVLYGEPKMTYQWWSTEVKVAQAVVWPSYHPSAQGKGS